MSGWKESLHSYAFQPSQQFRFTVGKNATDSALIIEAMDLLHAGTVAGFCIVSSDSDYTRLATRIREQGLFVMGIGRSDTPKSFVNACEVFVYTENLSPQEEDRTQVADLGSSDWTGTAVRAIEMATQDDGPDSPPDMVGSCLVCFQGVSGCRPGVTHDMIGHRTGSRVPSLRYRQRYAANYGCCQAEEGMARPGNSAESPTNRCSRQGRPMLGTARQPAPISSAAP